MENYESKYDEYKKSLLKTWYFTDKFKEKYKNTLSAEKNYIDQNGVLWKIGVLSAICGLCLAFFWSLEDKGGVSIIVRIVVAIVGISCSFWTMNIGANYKKKSGESNFYSYQYDRYIKDYVDTEKERETDKLLRDMLEKIDLIQWRAELLEEGSISEAEQLQSNLLYVINKSNDFQKRFDRISMYDRFAQDLQDDFYFSKAIHESLK